MELFIQKKSYFTFLVFPKEYKIFDSFPLKNCEFKEIDSLIMKN